MHEHYFTRCTDAPIVFNDLRNGELRHLCPGGEIARSVSTRLAPSRLVVTAEGELRTALHLACNGHALAYNGHALYTLRLRTVCPAYTEQASCCTQS